MGVDGANGCNPVVRVDDVWFRYEDEYVLKKVSLEIEKGDLLIVMGPNGSGKSTLLKILAGILNPQRGNLYFCGKPVKNILPSDLVKLVGYVHQNPWFHIFNPKVYDEITFTARNLHIDIETVTKNVLEIAAKLDIVDLLDRSPFTLSEGEARRVVIASSLVHRPLLLLLDEPTAGLDYGLKKRFVNIVNMLNTYLSTAVVIATHDVDLLTMLSRAKLVILNNGEIVYNGYVREALNSSRIFTENGLTLPVEVEIASKLKIDWSEVKYLNDILIVMEKLRATLCR